MPYYDKGGIVIYHGDCRDVLPTLEAGSVDLVLTDPPYNAGLKYGDGTNDKQSWPEYSQWLCPIIAECERVSSGMVLVFVSVSGLVRLIPEMPPRHVCAWYKPMTFSHRMGGSCFRAKWEPCLVYGKTWGKGGRVTQETMFDAWRHNTTPSNGHPCPKPLPLFAEILLKTKAASILDPFMGSGTTLRAAKDAGCRAVGIEIEERYCEIAARRLDQEVFAWGAAP